MTSDHVLPRRSFLKLSGAALLASLARCQDRPLNLNFPIEVQDDLLRGHQIMAAERFPIQAEPERHDILIVGAGMAGLAAAYRLRDRDTVICEIGRTPGGSSAAGRFRDLSFAQGAHYELEFPSYYGREVLALLEELQVIAFNGLRDTWEFRETRFLIDPETKTRCRVQGRNRAEVLARTPETLPFEEAMRSYAGFMPLPTRLIAQDYRFLDTLTFRAFLNNLGIAATGDLARALSYQIADDFGAGIDTVSALAGIHYYACRPYYERPVHIFSPPQGNFYFAEKLLAGLDHQKLLLSHAVARIERQESGWLVAVLDLENQVTRQFLVDRIVYAGHKKGVSHVYPPDASLFAHNRYAPWLAFNLVLSRPTKSRFWQNEVVGEDPAFLGFVNSRGQAGEGPLTVLTAYYCLDEASRPSLLQIPGEPATWVQRTLAHVNDALGERIDPHVIHVSIKLHGHAMPIPAPGYLFRDGNTGRAHPDLAYAGVDNGRLPLLFEALDSGLVAAELLAT